MSKKPKRKGPMSKFVVKVSMYEAWAAVAICTILVWFEKDISYLINIVTVSWAGYELVKSGYIWMAKNEHVAEIKAKYANTNNEEITEYLDQKSGEIEAEGQSY